MVVRSKVNFSKWSGISFSGPYQSWDLASSQSLGYDKEEILEKTLNTVLKVKSANWHMKEIPSASKSLPSIGHCLQPCEKKPCEATVIYMLSISAVLWEAYFQHLSMLSLCNLKWNIIERKQIVDAGQKHLADETLGFLNLLSFATNWGRLTSFFFPAFCNTCGTRSRY